MSLQMAERPPTTADVGEVTGAESCSGSGASEAEDPSAGYTALSTRVVLLAVARRLVPQLIEGTLIPTILFYGLLSAFDIRAAFAGALCWSYTALVRRAVVHKPIPPILILASVGITVRTVVALSSGSTFVYFIQPVLGTVAVSALFLGSIALGRPLIGRFAADFCSLSPAIACRPGVHRLYRRLTFLWAAVNLTAASATFVLLLTLPVHTFVIVRALTGWVITVTGIVLTVALSVQAARREDLVAAVAPGGRLTAICRGGVPALADGA